MTDHALLPDVHDQPSALQLAGQAANHAASQAAFSEYHRRKAKNTLRRQYADLALFAHYLREVGVHTTYDFATEPDAWRGITWGIVAGFVRWLLGQGYAISSINVRLSTIKTYAKLAAKADAISPTEYAMIRTVEGYRHHEGKRVDERREIEGTRTRVGTKKAAAVGLTSADAKRLKTQPDTPQGRRDALLLCLLLDHGLRCGEVAALTMTDVDLSVGELRFYRPKVDLVQTHRLTRDTLKAMQAWFASGDAPVTGKLLRGSRKGGKLTTTGMSERAITARVAELGKVIGVEGLSAHDCRHYWATSAVRNGTAIDRLMQGGGWTSPAMPLRYIQAAEIANDGVVIE